LPPYRNKESSDAMPTTPMNDDPGLISFQTLRKTVGWLGISLPLAMITGNFLFGSCTRLQDTVSHYYYTVTGDLFVGILCAVGLFLFTYKGYDRKDNLWTCLAGFFALCVALFPTNDNSSDSCAIIHLPDNELRRVIHYVSAAAFFLILAGISFFLFTKSRGMLTKEKKIRNKIYRLCGLVILLCIVVIGWYGLSKGSERWSPYKPVFWLEWVALLAFGISWLVKGDFFLEDGRLADQHND
jgi:uncharacterized protein YjeT (DUF2065 family)